eukprot:1927186-Pyramimonas_sp.AAC.1
MFLQSFQEADGGAHSKRLESGTLTCQKGLGRSLGLHAFRCLFGGEPPRRSLRFGARGFVLSIGADGLRNGTSRKGLGSLRLLD